MIHRTYRRGLTPSSACLCALLLLPMLPAAAQIASAPPGDRPTAKTARVDSAVLPLPSATLTNGNITVNATPAELNVAVLLPRSLGLPMTEELMVDAAERVLLPKMLRATKQIKNLAPTERRYLEQIADLGRLRGWYDIQENRALTRIGSDPAALEARAREIYRQRLPRLSDDTVANITIIDVQIALHGFDGAIARLQAARDRLRAGDSFETVLKQYTDARVAGAAMGAGGDNSTMDVKPEELDGAMRAAVFRRMKAGEISDPIPVATGFVIVRLNTLRRKEPPAFETVRQSIENEIKSTAVAEARASARRMLATAAPVFSGPLARASAPAAPVAAPPAPQPRP